MPAGCGDDDDSTETISKQEYVQRVEERCAEYQHERNAASKQLQSLGNPSKLTPQQLKDASGDIVALSDVTR